LKRHAKRKRDKSRNTRSEKKKFKKKKKLTMGSLINVRDNERKGESFKRGKAKNCDFDPWGATVEKRTGKIKKDKKTLEKGQGGSGRDRKEKREGGPRTTLKTVVHGNKNKRAEGGRG